MTLIDSHVNLHAEAFAQDQEQVIARARAAGVSRMITICDTWANAQAVAKITEQNPDIWMSVGAHPHYAKDHQDLTADALIDFAQRHPRVVGIGETGLDLHYNYSPFADQVRVLEAHIAAAKHLALPLIIHTRDADREMAEQLRAACADGKLRVLLHCYTSGMALAREALDLGAFISFSGIMTFKNAHDVREVAQMVPLDRVILETDCPYLAPVPHRGRRCEPAFVADVYAAFARLRGIDESAVTAQIAANFHALFARVPKTGQGLA
ncbi:MAG: TatD family hydrolase [Caulobacterales bacterium]|jgi:TatD DNase family protein